METFGIVVWLLACIGCAIIGIVFGFMVGEARLKQIKRVGYLIVDPEETEEHSGVYLQVGSDPKAYKDGEPVILVVSKVSQTKHGR